MKYAPISLNAHALLDGLLLGLMLVAPWLYGYTQYEEATQYSVGLFVIGMGLNVVTNYPLGLLRLLPMQWHRMVEFTSPMIFIVIPWLFFADAGIMPLIATGVGVGVLVNTALTRPAG